MFSFETVMALILGLGGIIFAYWFTKDSEKYANQRALDKYVEEWTEALYGPRKNV